MSLHLTLILLVLAVAATALCGWMGARPPDLTRGPRMAPYRLLMVTGATLVFFLVIHLINLAGIPTGPN